MKDEQNTPVSDVDDTTHVTTRPAEVTADAETPADENATEAFDPDFAADVDTPAPETATDADLVPETESVVDEADTDAATADATADDATDAHADTDAAAAASAPEPVLTEDGHPVQYGIGPFSLREVVLGGIWLVAFIVSFFPVYRGEESVSVWGAGIDWVLTIGAPTVAIGLLALRRLSPDGIRRVGSLGVDQFASVAFSVSVLVWLGILWGSFITFADRGFFLSSWVVWVEFFVMLAGVLLTTFAPYIAPFHEDFRHRPEVAAHRVASPARPVAARAAQIPAAAADPYASAAAQTSTVYGAEASEPQAATPAAHQAFWALAPVERDVVDEAGTPIFRIGPSAWALVIEDRGNVFVVRHEDGRIGYLTDVSGVTRG